MTTLLRRIPTDMPGAHYALAVTENGQHIGTVVLVLTERASGSYRRDWHAQPPPEDPRGFKRPFETRAYAISALQYRHHTFNKPEPEPPPDPTLQAITEANRTAGPAAALWLAANLTTHHLAELDAHRHANPPSLWQELHRVRAWLNAATQDQPGAPPSAAVDYRRQLHTSKPPKQPRAGT